MRAAVADKGPKRDLVDAIEKTSKRSKGRVFINVVKTQGQTTESDDDLPKTQPKISSNLPPLYPHPGAVFDGWWGLLDSETKNKALEAGRKDAHCDTVVWRHFVASLKKSKPELLSIIMYKHLPPSSKEALFGKFPTGSKAVPAMIEGEFKKLPDDALRFAFAGAKFSAEYNLKYKPAAWKWAMAMDAFKHYVVYHCIGPHRQARLREQLKENAEWEAKYGRLRFVKDHNPLPLPIATGNPEVDTKAREAWVRRYNNALLQARNRDRQALNTMIRTSCFIVRQRTDQQ
jgi:hypothetical protein